MAKQGKGIGCLKTLGVIVLVLILLVFAVSIGGALGAANSGKTLNDVVAAVSSEGSSEQQESDERQSDEAEGQVLYDGPDMTITYGSLDDVSVSGVAILNLIVENKTGENVSCIAEQGTLDMNGFNIDSVGGAQIQAGKKAVAQWTLSFKQANITNFDEIQSVSMNVQFITLGATVDVVAEAPISMTF